MIDHAYIRARRRWLAHLAAIERPPEPPVPVVVPVHEPCNTAHRSWEACPTARRVVGVRVVR